MNTIIYIYIYIDIRISYIRTVRIILLGWQLSNCGFFLENQRQFFHGTK